MISCCLPCKRLHCDLMSVFILLLFCFLSHSTSILILRRSFIASFIRIQFPRPRPRLCVNCVYGKRGERERKFDIRINESKSASLRMVEQLIITIINNNGKKEVKVIRWSVGRSFVCSTAMRIQHRSHTNDRAFSPNRSLTLYSVHWSVLAFHQLGIVLARTEDSGN